MGQEPYDLAIVGGGVNGCSIARDAAGRGLSVFLCEQGDLAGGTSSASTKLIHGGLRYLEYYEFKLVREALREREVLLRAAPHIIRPLRFVLPHRRGLRPAWLIRIGLFLYDHLGGRMTLPRTSVLDLRHDPAGAPLKPGFTKAFAYSDCRVDDARLVVLTAMDAAERGATIRVRTECVSLARDAGDWTLTLKDHAAGRSYDIRAKALVNATGPWIGAFMASHLGSETAARVRLDKGSHIVVHRLFDGPHAYIFQNADRRIVFAIPYERDFTLIGTTDVDYAGDPAAAAVSEAETDYLCALASDYFRKPVGRSDIVHSFAGVRPLFDDGDEDPRSVTREYVLALDAPQGAAPLLNIIGGKITTSRTLAEAALAKLAGTFPAMGPPWTAEASLPGGEFPVDGLADQVRALRRACPVLSEDHATRLVRAYGTRAHLIVDGVRQEGDLGCRFGADLYEREVAYLMAHEWAVAAEDVLWRRSKLGLRIGAEEAGRLDAWMSRARATEPVPAG